MQHPPSQKNETIRLPRPLERMARASQNLSKRKQRLFPVFRRFSDGVSTALNPVAAWNVYYGMGYLGVPSRVLWNSLRSFAIPFVASLCSLTIFDTPERFNALLDGRGTATLDLYDIVMVLGTVGVTIGAIAALPVFLGLWAGSLHRAYSPEPRKVSANIPNTGYENFITRVFNR